jgi:hypothetical protein
MSLEGVGSVCLLSCHATISVEEVHDWSFSCGSLLTNRLAQSATFKYCSMVFLADCGRPLEEGILVVCFWMPGPVIHMIWGTKVAGKRFTVLCPSVHRDSPYLRKAVSPPDHSNSHCSFEMSVQICCGSWYRTEVPMISSMRLLRIRRCLVAVSKEIPYPRGGSSVFPRFDV